MRCVGWVVSVAVAVKGFRSTEHIDDGLIRNAEAYWIIDPADQTCLTELGTFGACDDDALFMYLERGGGPSLLSRIFGGGGNKKRRSLTMVLEPVPKKGCLAKKKAHGRVVLAGGDCADVDKTQQWELLQSNTRKMAGYSTTSTDATAIALTTNRQKDCVVRDSSLWSREARYRRALIDDKSYARERAPKSAFANTVSVLKCESRGHTPLELTASNVAQAGFLFQSADGAHCYDGTIFRACSDEDPTLRWGIGVRFTKRQNRGRPETSLFKFYNATACLVEKGDNVGLGSCRDSASRGWGVTRGRLCRNGDCVKTGKCLTRSAFDTSARLFPCKHEVFEHLTLTLDSDGSDTLAQALQEAAARESVTKSSSGTSQSATEKVASRRSTDSSTSYRASASHY